MPSDELDQVVIKEGLAVVSIVAAPAALYFLLGDSEPGEAGFSTSFTIPELSVRAYEGREFFASACGSCHGVYGEGTEIGPPLLHSIYAPTVLDDTKFRKAVRHGAIARKWPFGDMPAVPGVSDKKLDALISFVRELQKANNIY